MNKKQLVITLIVLSLLATNAHAKFLRTLKIQWSKLPHRGELIKYENKEYAAYEGYEQAYYQGKCSSVWLWMHMEQKAKADLIYNIKKTFKEKENIIIRKPTEFYVQEIDDLTVREANSRDYPVSFLLRLIAVMEYDFDEGLDKERTAKRWLGEFYPVFKESQYKEYKKKSEK